MRKRKCQTCGTPHDRTEETCCDGCLVLALLDEHATEWANGNAASLIAARYNETLARH
jgi:hypothetical protein